MSESPQERYNRIRSTDVWKQAQKAAARRLQETEASALLDRVLQSPPPTPIEEKKP